MNKEILSFLKEYELLCQKYKMGLAGCGCCSSPYLVKDEDYVPIEGYIDYLPSKNKIKIGNETIEEILKGEKE